MKYHATNQIAEIKRLQEQARTLHTQALRALAEADELASELKEKAGTRFVCDGVPFKLEHRAVEIAPGNRYWLVLDTDTKIIDAL